MQMNECHSHDNYSNAIYGPTILDYKVAVKGQLVA